MKVFVGVVVLLSLFVFAGAASAQPQSVDETLNVVYELFPMVRAFLEPILIAVAVFLATGVAFLVAVGHFLLSLYRSSLIKDREFVLTILNKMKIVAQLTPSTEDDEAIQKQIDELMALSSKAEG